MTLHKLVYNIRDKANLSCILYVKMRTSEGIRYVIIIWFVQNVRCEVIVREANKKEGSLCFLRDQTKGVCRERCRGQKRNEYIENICNPGDTAALYCCVDNTEQQRYPTLQEVCLHRRLIEEFEQRGKEIADKLNEDLDNLHREYYERVNSVVDWCEETASSKREDERKYFLKHCLTIPQRPGSLIRTHHIGRGFKHAHLAGIGHVDEYHRISWMCSGTFIHPRYILTSAYCVLSNDKPNIVRAGPSNLKGRVGTDFMISETKVHSEHAVDGLYHDLAILKVEAIQHHDTPQEVVPACIYTKEDPQQGVTVMGYWGLSVIPAFRGTFFHGNISFRLSDECNMHDGYKVALPYGLIDSQVCARETVTDHDSCFGELGGALSFIEDGWLKIPYIVGVGSFGASCLAAEPSVYTLISPYLDWIESVISES